MSQNKNDVGIVAMEVYFPSTYVQQEELEVANGVSSGKYTIGLGQTAMAFTGDREDINSISLTVAQSLLEKYNISPKDIGRLEVGTETIVDKSKSTKTHLMDLFVESGNTDVEGATVVNACYGGTAALFNALSWVDSSAWDGRYALVVSADIAVYAEGPARPTGGCGAVAMLIGRNAALPIDLRTRATHASNVWDFFKPNLDSEYPVVNGVLSNSCYLKALDDCYNRFVKKQSSIASIKRSVDNTDYLLFHSPYNKLVQKSFCRMAFLDMLYGNRSSTGFEKFLSMPIEATYDDRELEGALRKVTSDAFTSKVAPACTISQQIGNTYTASVYMNLANLVSDKGEDLTDKSVTLFSYGSGALASMFEVRPTKKDVQFSLKDMKKNLNIADRLASREKRAPQDLNFALETREKTHGEAPFTPSFLTENLFPGTYYLDEINSQYERLYKRKPLSAPRIVGGALTSMMKLMK